MRLLVLALLAGLPLASAAAAQSAPSPIARVVVHPEARTMTSGDSLRLRAEALDAQGRPVPGVSFRFAPEGAYARANVSRDGLITSGNAGTFPILVTAMLPGAAPVTERVEIRMLAGPAAYVEITPPVDKLAVGQQWSLTATAYSRLREIRREPVTWKSSAPRVIEVDARGNLTALAPGRATITASGSGASASLEVEAVGTPIATIEIMPARVDARQGQVIRFQVMPRDASGSPVPGLKAVYSLSRKGAVISPEGIFVGYEPGEYVVTASFGTHSAEAVVQIGRPEGRDR